MYEEDIYSVTKRYRRLSLGHIAKSYTLEEEKKVYEEAANLIEKKYGNIITKKEIIDALSSNGRIYTMVLRNREGFYEYKTSNIGISHFLRLSTTLMHELVHKLGYNQKDASFDYMSNVFKEAGTEYVSATSLSDNFGRALIFNGVYSKFPEKTDSNFLILNLTNQINQAIGENKLEESILKGTDCFKSSIINRWGEGYYINLVKNIEDIASEEQKYWNSDDYISEDERTKMEQKLKEHILKVQNTILEVEFNKRYEGVDSREKAVQFLEELKEFELNRIRVLEIKDENKKYVDPQFKEIFSNYKAKLEAKFNKIDIDYDEDEWKKIFPKNKVIEEVNEEEQEEILILASDMKIKAQKNNFFERIFNKKKALRESGEDTSVVNKSIVKKSPPMVSATINNQKNVISKEKEENANDEMWK